MEIILIQDVENLGNKDEIVNVKPGYGRNYLIPQGFAKLATASAKKVHAENLKQKSHKEAKLVADAEEMVAKLQALKLKISVKTSSKGKIFGSVNTVMIAEAIENQGIIVDRKYITIKGVDVIKEIGNYSANIKLHKNIKANIDFEVVATED